MKFRTYHFNQLFQSIENIMLNNIYKFILNLLNCLKLSVLDYQILFVGVNKPNIFNCKKYFIYP